MTKLVRIIKKSDPKSGAKQVMLAINELYESTDKNITVTIEIDKDKRSTKQNSIFWLWNGEMQKHRYDHFGETMSTEAIHDAVVSILLPNKIEIVFGKERVILGKTSKLSVKQFAEFLTKYEIMAADDNCVFTQPPDQYFDALMKHLDTTDCTREGM